MKIALINPYFGLFPNYFPLVLNSIRQNPQIDWIFFTDDDRKYNWPDNAKVYYMSFQQVQELVQSKYDFLISLDKPYKLCDYKPAYGEIFKEYILQYDFWGHCDLDVIWGDLSKYITDEMLDKYEMLYREGALRLYKNTKKINELYKLRKSIFDYREVFTHKEVYGFDEALSIQRIAEKSDVTIYHNDNAIADIDAFQQPMYIRRVAEKKWADEAGIFRSIRNYTYQIFQWKDGEMKRLYLEHEEIHEDEFMYLHLLKRKMEMKVEEDCGAMLILPDAFIPLPIEISSKQVETWSQGGSKVKESFFKKCIRKLKRAGSLSVSQRKITLKKVIFCSRKVHGFFIAIKKEYNLKIGKLGEKMKRIEWIDEANYESAFQYPILMLITAICFSFAVICMCKIFHTKSLIFLGLNSLSYYAISSMLTPISRFTFFENSTSGFGVRIYCGSYQSAYYNFRNNDWRKYL